MTTLLNQELRINPNTLTCSLEELQIKIERENKEKAFTKFITNIEKSKAKKQLDSLPSYNNLLKKVYLEAQSFWDEKYTYNITTKAKKQALWNNLIKPVNEAYLAIVEEDAKAKNYTTEPRDLIPYLVAQELLKPLFTIGFINALSATNLIVKRITTAYRMERVSPNTESPLIIGVLEFLRSVATLSTSLDTTDVNNLEAYTEKLSRGNYFILSTEVARDVVKTYNATVASTKNVFEPMVVKPNKHTSLHDRKGGYLTINSELHKHFYGSNTTKEVFNSTTNSSYFSVKNSMQETAFSVNTNLLNFIDKLNTEEPNLLSPHLIYNHKKELVSLNNATEELKEQLIELRTKEKDLWKVYYKNRDIADKLRKKIKEQSNPTSKQLKQLQDLDNLIHQTLSDCDSLQKTIKAISEPIQEAQSRVSKAQANRRTLDIAVKYQDFKEIYFPIFVGSNDRTYYYTSDFHPQGNNLCKSLISFAKEERMDEQGFESFKYCFGTIFEGMSKKVKELRIKAVEDNHEAIMDFVTRQSNRFLDLIDKDEIFTAISYAIEYYNHLTNPEYKTKVIVYIDSCSSAIQIQGLTQKCEQCLTLTSVINPKGDKLEDAYMVTAKAMESAAQEIISMSDSDLMEAINSLF
ncbi:hypothetical protein [Vibrio parahaemolyticus]|uniref:hypothetical protein n=1 Tax=Vibrio parahaemolyticus TaxID=670 RepID=UPI0005F12340|nr:hypothetical protein [Vibrio parahaemolyticus]KJR15250.1 hypothetical protein UF28_16425 [Vibrio parahaemolyticus]